MRVLIIGYGTVGQATHSLIECMSNKIEFRDPKYDEYEHQCYANFDVIFICIPVSSVDGAQDLKPLKEILKAIKKDADETHEDPKDDPIVVLKSSLLYENVQELMEIYNKVVVNPEFLNENTAFEDVQEQPIILGGKYSDVAVVKRLYDYSWTMTHDSVLDFEICSIEQACNFKYVHNLYSIWKLMFWEMVQDLTHDERKMYHLYKKFQTPDMAVVGLDGYRGIGGKCFPDNLECTKDKHNLLKAIYEYNKELKNE